MPRAAVDDGEADGAGEALHVGRSAIISAFDVDNDGKLVSTGRCTIAVRPNA